MKHALTRNLIALAIAAMGAIDLWSALASNPPERLVALVHLVPTEVLDTSRTFTLLAGAMLLVTAFGLRRGKRRAFLAALFLCAISVPFNLLKALDVEEATVAAALMFVLGANGQAFQVKSREFSLRVLKPAALAAALGFALYAVLGSWIVASRFGVDGASLGIAVREALYQTFGLGAPAVALKPGLTPLDVRVITWYQDSLLLVALVLLIGLALAGLQPVAHRRRHREERERVAALIARYGDATVCAFALNPDVDYFFSSNRRAVIAYRFESDTLLTVGDPIGPREELVGLLDAFEHFCHEHDWQFGFFQARPEYLALYEARGWRALHIGEDPVLWTDRFTLTGAPISDIRRAVRRVEGAGVEALMFIPGTNAFDAKHDPDGLFEQMRAISNAWLRDRPGGEKGFCMGRFDEAALASSWLAVAWEPARRHVHAFMTWVPIPARRGWALDLMRRLPDSPVGVMEFLVARSVEAAKARGDALLSLSLSALVSVDDVATDEAGPDTANTASAGAPAAPATPAPVPAAPEPSRARDFLMEHLSRFYDFKNLFRWKKKFVPAFEDRFLVYAPGALPRVVLALARAQSPGGLSAYLRRGVARPAAPPATPRAA